MINIKPHKVEVQSLLGKSDKSDKKVVQKTLHDFAVKSDENHSIAYNWVLDTWGDVARDAWQDEYQKVKKVYDDKQALALWREGLNPFQKTARFLLGDDKKLPKWLGGETNPVQAREDEAASLARVRSTFNGNTGITAHLDY